MDFLGRLVERNIHVVDKKKRDGTRESYLKDDLEAPNNHDKAKSRFIDRDGQFFQSEGEIAVKRKVVIEDVIGLFYAGDPVLFLVNMKTINCCLMLLCIYILWTIIMAIPWLLLGLSNYHYDVCHVDTNTFARAYVFSIEIMMTIGFGALDIYFGGCALPIIVLTVHSCISLALQAAVMGILYQRISRNRSRRKTVVMSNKAVLRRIRGKLYFMFQICELRKRQLVEANVRLYAVKYEPLPQLFGATPGIKAPFSCQTYAMRLAHPNDDLGAKLLLSTPQVVVHEIDDHSPILPPPDWTPGSYQIEATNLLSHESGRQISLFGLEVGTNKTPFSVNPLQEETDLYTEMLQHPAPSSTPSPNPPQENNSFSAPTTRRSQYSFPNIIQRKAYTLSPSYARTSSTYEEEIEDDSEEAKEKYLAERNEITQYMNETRLEIIVILEGVDPLTSHTVQAFHSYKSEEIEWDQFFAPCTFLDSDGWTIIDFMKFHNLISIPNNARLSSRAGSVSHC